MKNYIITIQYDGTNYNGWQKQNNTHNTIQERFETVLEKMCGEKIDIFASGRTDAGVHARCQVANFKCNTDMTTFQIGEYLNHYLPTDILVMSTEEVADQFHSRLNAISKTYEYTIALSKPDVFIRKYVYFSPKSIDVSKMREIAKSIIGTHDFIGFSSVKKSKKSTIRTVNHIDIIEVDNLVKIRINANGFLYNMVRIISGTLYESGLGKITNNDIEKIFQTKKRSNAGITLPAQGLMLDEVFYK